MKNIGLFLFSFLMFVSAPLVSRAAEDAGYYQHLKSTVLPFVQSNMKYSRVKSFDGIELSYAILQVPNSKGTIFLSPGRSESVIGQTELIYQLAQAGFSVAAIDHRGQGFSQRLLKNSDAGHVVNFVDYVKDFKVFATQVVQQRLPKPYFFLGHSMGAAIGSHFAIVNPNFFTRMVVAAPMYRISKNGFLSTLIFGAAKGLFTIGWGDTLAPSRKPYDFDAKFARNVVTHSEERFKFDVWLAKKNPVTAIGGPTTNWVLEASRETVFLRRSAAKLKTPMVIIQAGADSVVSNNAQHEVCAAAKDCRLFIVPGAYHNIFMELDQYRTPAIGRALDFFLEAAPVVPAAAAPLAQVSGL